jgi:hypothetical protein
MRPSFETRCFAPRPQDEDRVFFDAALSGEPAALILRSAISASKTRVHASRRARAGVSNHALRPQDED